LAPVETNQSILASIGHGFAFFFQPLGFGNWKATIAAITGLLAKETVIASFGILYKLGETSESNRELWTLLQQDYSALSAYSFLIFNLLCAPCFAAIGAIHREMGNAKWTWIAVGFQTGLAYAVSLIIYQLGAVFLYHHQPTIWTGIALILLSAMVYSIVRKPASALPIVTLKNLQKEQMNG
jgi:ferrous iron transport protein B